ncbi:DUF6808 domain-containing protein [Muribaculum intestinale]|uniref:DUF6808 domain-containing protein n=1 Tax=Muribaculum intestinale TaxID=1796646 RepID=UPI003365077A
MKFWGYILVFLLFIGSFFAGRWTKSPYERIVERRDTVIIRDTMTEYIPVPKYITYIRTDTCYLPALADSGHSPVLVPIDRKIYQTPDYRAVIEGYQASLLEIQVYPQKMVVTPKKPTSKSRWGRIGADNRKIIAVHRNWRSIQPIFILERSPHRFPQNNKPAEIQRVCFCFGAQDETRTHTP